MSKPCKTIAPFLMVLACIFLAGSASAGTRSVRWFSGYSPKSTRWIWNNLSPGECAKKAGRFHVVYDRSQRRCGKATSLSNLRRASNHILMLSIAARRNGALRKTRKSGTDFPGHDYRRVTGIHVNLCEALCAHEDKCDAYAYRPSTKQCWLKEEVGRRSKRSGRISGYVGWNRDDAPVVVELGRGEFSGQAIGSKYISESSKRKARAACKKHCRSSVCTYATLKGTSCKRYNMNHLRRLFFPKRPYAKSRWVYTKLNQFDRDKYMSFVTSHTNCRKHDGSLLKNLRYVGEKQCRAVCAKENACVGFTYDTTDRTCRLMKSIKKTTKGACTERSEWLVGDASP